LKLKNKIILVTRLVLVSSFLFAGEIINQNKVDTSTPITETESENLVQHTSINITNNVDPSSITRDGTISETFSYSTTSETFSYTGSEQTFTAHGALQ
jgi:hypothetical protein